MAYSEQTAERVRVALAGRGNFVEKKMFGGIAFFLNGNICIGVQGDDLILRLGEEQGMKAFGPPYVKEFDPTGRTMKGWVQVELDGFSTEAELAGWMDQAIAFVETLPPK